MSTPETRRKTVIDGGDVALRQSVTAMLNKHGLNWLDDSQIADIREHQTTLLAIRRRSIAKNRRILKTANV